MKSRVGALTAVIAVALLHVSAPQLSAQQRVRKRPPAARAGLPREATIRGEYANVLLRAKRYDEAAAEYRRLIATDGRLAAYQLGLARALAWGGHPRDAEPVLRALTVAQPRDTVVARMLVEVRVAMLPSAREAAAWLREAPRDDRYRLALARALVRERRFADASAQFDTLLVHGETVSLLREAAGTRATAHDSTGSARLLGRAVALAPGDTTLLREYAQALSWSGDRRAAIERYSGLLRRRPGDAMLLFARGQLYVWSGDYTAGERDLLASIAIRPTRDAYAMLGDAYKWRGDFERSRAAYASALAMAPGDTVILAAIDDLERARAGVVASSSAADVGWVSQFTHSEDNAGFLYLATSLGRGVAIGRASRVSLTAEQRRISTRSSVGPERYVYGFAVSGGAGHRFEYAEVDATAGVARHGLVRDIPFGEVRVSASRRSLYGAATVSTGPVYLPLVSAQSLVHYGPDGVQSTTPLVGRTAQLSASVPLGMVSASFSTELTSLNDGNHRSAAFVSLTRPLARGFSALYNGFAVGYSARSDRYWDPELFNSHSAGLQYEFRRGGSWRVAARVLPGIGRATENFTTSAGASIRGRARTAAQLQTGGEVGYRVRRWDVAFAAGYNRGREGEYQSLNSTLRLRLVP